MSIFTMIVGGLLFVVLLIFVLNRLSFNRRAVFINLDSDQSRSKHVAFVERSIRYRVVKDKTSTKAYISGNKLPIAYSDDMLNPSHSKNNGAVIVKYQGNYFFADVEVDVFEKNKEEFKEKVKSSFIPIEHDLKKEHTQNCRDLYRKFTPQKAILISGGIIVIAMVISFLMIYFTTEKVIPLVDQTQNLAHGLNGLKTFFESMTVPN